MGSSSRHGFSRRAPSDALALVVVLGAVGACADFSAPPGAAREDPRVVTSSTGASCGVSYTTVLTLVDDELADYEVPSLTDSARVCETWTGSDYSARITSTGSSEPASEYSDSTAAVTYEAGTTTGYTATGAPTTDGAEVIGADAFDVVQATAAERQASYDAPYYGVYSGGGGGGGGGDECLDCEIGLRQPAANVVTAAGVPGGTPGGVADSMVGRFVRHGLSRRGVRALVDDKDEIARSPLGRRRFRSMAGDEETIIEIDPATELMVAQSTSSPRGRTQATLRWARRRDGWVRERLEVESVETVNGIQRRGRATVVISNLVVGGQP